MSKRDDGQWATNIAFHRSPLYPKPEKAGADTARVKRKPKAKTNAGMATKKPNYESKRECSIQNIVETILLQWTEREEPKVKRTESPYRTIREWTAYVRVHYKKCGELPAQKDLVNIVAKSLISLSRKGHARQIAKDNSTGKWKISSCSIWM